MQTSINYEEKLLPLFLLLDLFTFSAPYLSNLE